MTEETEFGTPVKLPDLGDEKVIAGACLFHHVDDDGVFVAVFDSGEYLGVADIEHIMHLGYVLYQPSETDTPESINDLLEKHKVDERYRERLLKNTAELVAIYKDHKPKVISDEALAKLVDVEELPPVVPTLADPEHRKNAIVFQVAYGSDRGRVVLKHMPLGDETPMGDIGFLYAHGVDLFQPKELSMDTIDHLFDHAGIPLVYRDEFLANNARFLAKHGSAEDYVKVRDEPATIYNLDQKDIPVAIASDVEQAWTAFEQPLYLPALAHDLGDNTIIISESEYGHFEKGVIKRRLHPRHPELFAKYLHLKAKTLPVLEAWLHQEGI
jgi:hypothetical protein